MMKVNCDREGIAKASDIAKKVGVGVFPTDARYGIGCDPFNKNAIERIYKIKSREKTKQLPVLVFSKEIASKIVEFDKESYLLVEKFRPDPLTLILKLKDESLKKSLNLEEKISIRVPSNKSTLKLLEKCNFLLGTSANVSGEESFTDPSKCYQSITGYDLFLDGGRIFGGTTSTIVEVSDGILKIHREGVLTLEEMSRVL